ncbi:MAG TPA: prepilin-type N-terminal cleavage/methylation domain-containing protein [Phycisphaerae bacterium]|nr:prepilin-type N-terminal cleavage/methylation domain-containing protein [Phycisphaerae bacterium]
MRNRRHNRRAGFTLIEVLIAVTLSALLLAAVAVAMSASLYSYEQNTGSADSDQVVRTLLMRMRREMRTADAIDFGAPGNEVIIYPPANDRGIEKIRYEYDYGQQKLIYHLTVSGDTTSETLLDPSSPVKVLSFYTTYYTAQDEGGVWYTQRAVVQIYVQEDASYRTITCSAAPRRNVTY